MPDKELQNLNINNPWQKSKTDGVSESTNMECSDWNDYIVGKVIEIPSRTDRVAVAIKRGGGPAWRTPRLESPK